VFLKRTSKVQKKTARKFYFFQQFIDKKILNRDFKSSQAKIFRINKIYKKTETAILIFLYLCAK